jgi:hypothetical protein
MCSFFLAPVFFVPVVIFRMCENETDIKSLPVVMDCCNHPEVIPAHVKYGIGSNVVGRVKRPPHVISAIASPFFYAASGW